MLSSDPAKIMWLSYFKNKLACSADEYLLAMNELSLISGADLGLDKLTFMKACNYKISVEHQKDIIEEHAAKIAGGSSSAITHQLKLELTELPSKYIKSTPGSDPHDLSSIKEGLSYAVCREGTNYDLGIQAECYAEG